MNGGAGTRDALITSTRDALTSTRDVLTSTRDLPPTVAEAIADAGTQLKNAGIADARREARLLAERALGIDPAQLFGHPDAAVAPEALTRLRNWVRRRSAREPVSHIVGERSFWTLTLKVDNTVLDPRPDSEVVIEAILKRLAATRRDSPRAILDLGTGSGCLLLALLSELPNAHGIGVDLSEAAARMARRNADKTGLAKRSSFMVGNWSRALTGPFDIIVTNPPYIRESDIDALAPEVAHYEPRLALSGGEDGLNAYRTLIPDLARIVAPDGVIGIEIGSDQMSNVTDIATKAGLQIHDRVTDFAGHARGFIAGPDLSFDAETRENTPV